MMTKFVLSLVLLCGFATLATAADCTTAEIADLTTACNVDEIILSGNCEELRKLGKCYKSKCPEIIDSNYVTFCSSLWKCSAAQCNGDNRFTDACDEQKFLECGDFSGTINCDKARTYGACINVAGCSGETEITDTRTVCKAVCDEDECNSAFSSAPAAFQVIVFALAVAWFL